MSHRRASGALGALGVIATLGLVGLLLGAPAVYAQAPAGTRANAGDLLHVDVEGRADISGDFMVDKGGNVTLPSVGRVPAAGRTTSEIGTDIARRMSLISSKITQVTVTIVQSASRRNFVLGAVLLPGMYVFRDPPTVWEAITEAGGPTDDANLAAVEIFSESQPKPAVVDVTSLAAGGLTALPRLRPGDTVRVPRLSAGAGAEKGLVYVFGAVGAQGPQPLNLAPDLVSVFIRSVPAADADFKNVEIVRKNGPQIVRMKVRMDAYFGHGDLAGNPLLQSGDTIHFHRERGFTPLRVVGAVASVVGLATSILVLTR